MEVTVEVLISTQLEETHLKSMASRNVASAMATKFNIGMVKEIGG